MRRAAIHAAIFSSLAAAAVPVSAAPDAAREPGSRQTREFVQAAASSDQFEILEAKAALGQSDNPDIRTFATRMIEDHEQISRALMDAVTRSGLETPAMAMSGDQSRLLSALQAVNGPDFDKNYVRQQALAHRSALAVEQMYAASGDDPDVRQAAAAAIPLISSHAEMAEQMAAQLDGS